MNVANTSYGCPFYREKKTKDMIFFIFRLGPRHNATLYITYTFMQVYIFTLILFTIYFAKYLRFSSSCIPVNEWHRNELNENNSFLFSSFWDIFLLVLFVAYAYCQLETCKPSMHGNVQCLMFNSECNSFANQILFY